MEEPMRSVSILKRSIVVSGHKTSVSLEDEFWTGLREIAVLQQKTLSDLIAGIEEERRKVSNLSSAIRLFVLRHYRDQRHQQKMSPALGIIRSSTELSRSGSI
jgi:predicted DNA-binding ribbon-helix-helix protein